MSEPGCAADCPSRVTMKSKDCTCGEEPTEDEKKENRE
jgi:hypothetical protein